MGLLIIIFIQELYRYKIHEINFVGNVGLKIHGKKQIKMYYYIYFIQ